MLTTCCRLVNHFDVKCMRDAPLVARKSNETSDTQKQFPLVPHENTYVFEIFQLLVSSLPPEFNIDPGFNTPGSSRTNIVVTNENTQRVVLEMLAHERDGPVTRSRSVLGHFERCKTTYSQIDNVSELWVHYLYCFTTYYCSL
jgi:hypothetical protein